MNFIYKLKTIKDDFVVKEVPLEPYFLNKKDSEYTYIWVEKKGLTTFDAMDKLRTFFKLNNDDIRHQGLKDEDGVTYQIISLKKKLMKSAYRSLTLFVSLTILVFE